MKKLKLAIISLLSATAVFAQKTNELESIIEGEKAAWLRQNAATERGLLNAADNRSDITYTRFHFWVDPAVKYIRGEILTVFEPIESVSSLNFDFSAMLKMDSIVWHGQKLVFFSAGDILTVQFPTVLPAVLPDSLTFFYQGEPTSSGFGAFETNTHAGTPVMWTLSEPYGAKEWMPCKQSLTDKIDSVVVYHL
jgi:aminopeptidase N